MLKGWRDGASVATLLLLGAALLHVVLTFDVHGISNDEEVQHVYGRLLLDFYRSGFADQRAFEYLNLRHYGGLFDMLAAALEPLVPLDVWDLRHLLSAGFGVTGLAATALLARAAGTPRAGLFAAGALALCGAWSGAMFTHTKDVTFGAAMAWALYGILATARQMPRPGLPVVTLTGLALGAALGLRFGALLAVGYLGIACLAAPWMASAGSPALRLSQAVAALPRLLLLAVIATATMAVFWPWSVTGWDHLLETVRAFSHYALDLPTLLDGQLFRARDVPASYLPHYLLVRLPEVMLVGLALAPIALRERPPPPRALGLLVLALGGVLPVVLAVATRPALYNGIRHFTFVLPPLAALAGVGLDAALRQLAPHRLAAATFATLLALLAADTAVMLVRLHPYQSVAYNRLAGGVPGAVDRYELDYWADSIRPAIAALNQRYGAQAQRSPRPLLVAVCAESVQASHWLAPGFVVTRDWHAADFFVTATQNDCEQHLAGEVVVEVRRLGVTLALVKDRRDPAERAEE
jgi:hypothetical protein